MNCTYELNTRCGNMIKNIIFDIGNVLLRFDAKAKLESSVLPITKNIKMLEDLSRNYYIYAITDASIQQVNFEKSIFDFFNKFRDILISDECHLSKNTPEIYNLFINKHKLLAEETVFIDDNKENIKAAQKSGIHGLYFISLANCIASLKKLGVQI